MLDKTFLNSVQFEVKGQLGCFSDPLLRTSGERFSYQFPTQEAIKHICEDIYWKPPMIWVVDKIRVMNESQYCSMGATPLKFSGDRGIATTTYLAGCRYQVDAHFVWNYGCDYLPKDADHNKEFLYKHSNIAKRYLERGGRRPVYLGTSECVATIEPCMFGTGEGFYDGTGEMEIGMMHHGFTYQSEIYHPGDLPINTANMWNAKMENGVIVFPLPFDENVRRREINIVSSKGEKR